MYWSILCCINVNCYVRVTSIMLYYRFKTNSLPYPGTLSQIIYQVIWIHKDYSICTLSLKRERARKQINETFLHENFKNDNMKSNIFIHINLNSFVIRDCRGGDRMVVGFTTNCTISDYSRELEPGHGEVYLIQHYVIKFVSDLRQVGDFLWIPRFPPPMKLTSAI